MINQLKEMLVAARPFILKAQTYGDDLRNQQTKLLDFINKLDTKLPSWDDLFIATAQLYATKSKDRNTKIGAVLVGPDNEVVSTGYNSFPRDLDDSVEERYMRPEKYYWTEHAERNCLYNAARMGIRTKGCRMFLSCWIPCTDCARAIIQCGVVEVILGAAQNAASSKWQAEGERSEQMFKEAGVEVRFYEV